VSEPKGSGPHPARRLWAVIERIHAVIYFDEAARQPIHEAGVPGFWRSYFGARAAPLGPVPAEVVTALFFGFHPDTVARAVPDVWHRCPPERILAARRTGCAAALERLTAGTVPPTDLQAAADAVVRAAGRVDTAGRALAAANQALSIEGPAWERLWQGCTTLREHRGDGHVAALVAAGLNGLDGHVLQAATEAVPPDVILPARGWSEDEWEVSAEGLRSRGWLDADGRATDAGRAAKADVEATTDRLAGAGFGGEELITLTATCAGIAAALDAAGYMRFPNPMGLPDREPGSGL
jgi:hypothetical protein